MAGKVKLALLMGITVLYFILPLIAGVFEIGDRWGPKIYPIALHAPLYKAGWKVTHFNGKKPLIGFWYKREYRPWFYGLDSRNEDPLQIKKGLRKIEKAIER